MATQLSEAHIAALETLLHNDDRTGYYIRYYELTGSEQTMELAKISSFSGYMGEVANIANDRINNEVGDKYHPEGVIAFSRDIADAHFAKVRESFDAGHGGIVSDEEIIDTAASVWDELALGDYFPGNYKQGINQLLEGNLSEAADELFSDGTRHGIASAAYALFNDDYENNAENYQGQNYQTHRTDDNKYEYIIDVANNRVVHISDMSEEDELDPVLDAISPVEDREDAPQDEGLLPEFDDFLLNAPSELPDSAFEPLDMDQGDEEPLDQQDMADQTDTMTYKSDNLNNDIDADVMPEAFFSLPTSLDLPALDQSDFPLPPDEAFPNGEIPEPVEFPSDEEDDFDYLSE